MFWLTSSDADESGCVSSHMVATLTDCARRLVGAIRRKPAALVALMMCALAASCSIYSAYEQSKPANVMKLEARLTQAGFHRVSIDTPEQDGAVAELPLHRLNRYDSAQGSVFWYADPTICHCLYQGDEVAYQRYLDLLQQEQETAEYENDVRPEQVAYLSPFGYAFPPPLLLGGWPLLIPGDGGGFHPRPVIGVHPGGGGGGGGIHMRGGGGRGGHR
jgi:hypothetical protein